MMAKKVAAGAASRVEVGRQFMDWPERQALCPGAPFGVYSPAGAGPAAQAPKEVRALWLTAELGSGPGSLQELPRRRCSLGVGRAADRGPAALRWTRFHAEFAPDGGLDRVIVSATNLTAQRRAVEALRD